jgi:acyl-coenzyme A thioesterase 13
MGKNLAYTKVELLHPDTGAVLASGSHTKFVGKAWTDERNVEFDDNGQLTKGKVEDS